MATDPVTLSRILKKMIEGSAVGNILTFNERLYDRLMQTAFGARLRTLSPLEKKITAQVLHLAYGLFDGLTPDESVLMRLFKDILRDVSPEIASRLKDAPAEQAQPEQERAYRSALEKWPRLRRELEDARTIMRETHSAIVNFRRMVRNRTRILRRQ